MTNEKVIKLELCPDLGTQTAYYPPENNFTQKGDVYSLGCVFYQLTFLIESKESEKNPSKFEKFETGDTEYSKEILDLIKSMLEKDPNKRPSSEELLIKIRNLYDEKIKNNSSITSLISCLYSINYLTKKFFENKSKFADKNLTPISSAFYECLINIDNKEKWNESIKNFRRYLGTKNPKLDSEKEVDPFFLLVFLVENMFRELNVKPLVDLDINQGYLIKRKEDKTNKADMVINFFRYFKEHFNSILSESIFGIMKNKNTCKECGLKTYSFNSFCFLYFDVDKFQPKEGKPIDIQEFFDELRDGKLSSDLKNEFFCKGCSKLTQHCLEKKIYYMPNSLIICFISKKNNYKYEIDFPDFIDLQKEREYSLSSSCFNLRGFIYKIVENGKEKYYSSLKSPINDENYICNDFVQESEYWDKSKGNVVMVFYG